MNDTSEEVYKREPIFSVAFRTAALLTPILSGLISAIAFGYLVGWVQAKSYFSAFGATWVVDQLPPFHLLRFSIVPILIVVFITWCVLIDSAKYEEQNDGAYRKGSQWVLQHGWWILSCLLCAGYVTKWLKYYEVAIIISWMTMFGYATFIGTALERLFIHLRQRSFVVYSYDAQLVVLIAFAGLYFVPHLNGSAMGILDANPKKTDLPVIISKSLPENSRLLAMVNNNLFAVTFGNSLDYPTIRILTLSDVFLIEHSTKEPHMEVRPASPKPPSPTVPNPE